MDLPSGLSSMSAPRAGTRDHQTRGKPGAIQAAGGANRGAPDLLCREYSREPSLLKPLGLSFELDPRNDILAQTL